MVDMMNSPTVPTVDAHKFDAINVRVVIGDEMDMGVAAFPVRFRDQTDV